MNFKTPAHARATRPHHSTGAPLLARIFLAVAALLVACAPALAWQAPRKLPAPEKIVGQYLKAVGGKKRWAAVRDAVYEWRMISAEGEWRVRGLMKAPSSLRTELRGQGVEVTTTVNPRMAWRSEPGVSVSTLTGGEAHAAKLQAVLGAGHLVDFKKMKVLARTVGVEEIGGEPAYVVEFSTREGARERFWFGVRSRLLLKTADAAGKGGFLYSDYRPVGGVLVPHRSVPAAPGPSAGPYVLASVRFNTGLADSLFEPPADASLDIPALLRDLARNQDEVDQRVNDYTFTRKVTEREVSDRGEVKKEKVSIYEVYPVQGWGWVTKLVSEDGRPLPPERAAKEEKRAAEELEKAAREGPKRLREQEQKRARERARRAEKRRRQAGAEQTAAAAAEADEEDVDIATFLRVSELVSPRRETFRGRDTIVFDFRPRPGFRPRNRGESVASKLSGVVWVDPGDRQVVRLEARLVEGIKIAGGLMASVKPGSAFAFEQTRLADGVWLPRFTQINLSARVLLFAGLTLNQTEEFGDYKRFDARTDDGKINAPEEAKEP